jgi:hypothetical protein
MNTLVILATAITLLITIPFSGQAQSDRHHIKSDSIKTPAPLKYNHHKGDTTRSPTIYNQQIQDSTKQLPGNYNPEKRKQPIIQTTYI